MSNIRIQDFRKRKQEMCSVLSTISLTDESSVHKSTAGEEETLTSEKPRHHWGKQIEFLLSCVGYSVGLGNIWRFPYLCMQNGGGAFLVPYILYLIICGTALFFMETAIGQSTGLSTIRIFSMIPFFSGLGWCMVFASGILSIYYNIIVAYTIYYIGMSFTWVLPWSHCDNEWNTPQCFSFSGNETSNQSLIGLSTGVRRTAAEEFWRYNVLEISEDISVLNGIQWKLLLALIAAWILTFVCMCKGILSSGKVVYVTATAPYIFLTVILIRGCTLPGAWYGIKFYIVPDWSRLKSIDVWISAATQIFYSLGPAWGGLITFGSFNKYTHNVQRDAILIPIICGSTSIYGGFAIFSVIGHLMHATGTNDTEQFVQQGPGLAFIAYPQALTMLPGAAIWSVLFFLMLFTLGIDSQFSTLEAVTTGLNDRFPRIVGKHRMLLTLVVCFVEFLLGLILVTRAGFYYFELLDTYATAFSVVVIGFLESIVIGYLYGAQRLLDDIEWMIGPMRKATRYWWILLWCFFVPVLTLAIIVSTFVSHAQSAEEKLKKFPEWAIIVGWTISCLSFVQFPIMAIVAVSRHGCNWRKLFRPDDEWEFVVQNRRKECPSSYELPVSNGKLED
ncbi:Sodium- and chloride-dependent glycine transporter 2, variant 2 [Clonorchis sinensis]|uniref:Sodium- and chloride-dependent glycine transporter 2, variant 2 n=2 Tax=Clonorchis sinensis TaxID=79923 RepID=A0A8T1M5W5_CLOSI|nr:Sodium- and chloride-dependent glycine transporter 2, variant 2 [Clonorchis sinensis]GAA30788.2 sodium- and chloride-dependent glycine transporter 2 [Clonorchis sinensis]